MQARKSLELTLAILKPHVVKCPFVLQKIRDLIIENNFKIVRTRRTILTSEEAALFYFDHKDKFFYNRLLTFMCSGPSDIHILAGHDAIVRWRELMGPTKTYQAQYIAPNSIRDSPEAVKREIAIFFEDFDMKQWYEREEIFYNLEKLQFDPISFVHIIDKSSLVPTK
ncbi:nucleoside diphosphate kinase 6-like isoform X3 [Vespa mandarinia]|uniref:nucleoside diphosphate kinase 6-like isoform X3 n=1 Tax=Vespa mandarinia TaxID=7446 RepID=UPI00161E79CB|nr:nucleoside diphosphate kinase 6-like isoform X3 [Vespa mandarinia]